ncbi:MAG: 4Fe-4S dicluster domain-containing protein [Candidatus Woesearchaeota archaeon]
MNLLAKKNDLNNHFSQLIRKYEVIAPVKNDTVAFNPISSFEDIYLDEQTTFSFKKYILPNKEKLFSFKNGKPVKEEPEIPERILCMRPCDANALLNIDRIYLDENPDEMYRRRRENTYLFVFKCKQPGKNCFCSSVGTLDPLVYDVLFIDIGNQYILIPGTKKGRELVKNKRFAPIIRDGRIVFECERKAENLDRLETHMDDPEWEKAAEKCLNCNACISVCPTCMCFDIRDELNVDEKSGDRVRYWDYCHMKDFTKVAGGFVFRENKINRFRHRILHKLKYFKERQGRHLCVGCGRCINVCPAGIDMLKIIDNLGKNDK